MQSSHYQDNHFLDSTSLKVSNAKWENDSYWTDSMIDSIACGEKVIHFTEKDNVPTILLEFYQTIRGKMDVFMDRLVFQNLHILFNTKNYRSIWDSVLESHMTHPQIMRFVLQKKNIDRVQIMNLVEKYYISTFSSDENSSLSFEKKKKKKDKRSRTLIPPNQVRKLCILEKGFQDETTRDYDEKDLKMGNDDTDNDTAYLITRDIKSVKSFVTLGKINYQILYYTFDDIQETFDTTSLCWKTFSLKDWTMFFYENRGQCVKTRDTLTYLAGEWVESFYNFAGGDKKDKKEKRDTRDKRDKRDKKDKFSCATLADNLFDLMGNIKLLVDFSENLVSSYPRPLQISKKLWISIINILENIETSFLIFQEKLNQWFLSFFDIVKRYWKINTKKMYQPYNYLAVSTSTSSSSSQSSFICEKVSSIFYDQSTFIQNLKEDFFDILNE
jgi:hypothetical protein